MQTNRLYWSLLLILATCCGLGITALTLRQAASPSIALGAWLTDPLAGNTKADLYTRARIAVTGLFALDKSETLYFVARQDDKGQALRSRCQYRISGVQPAARWWSITAYADDYFLFDAEQQRYSASASQFVSATDAPFSVSTGPDLLKQTGEPVNLHTPGDRPMILTLRLYNPDKTLQDNPGSLQAPRIELVGVCP